MEDLRNSKPLSIKLSYVELIHLYTYISDLLINNNILISTEYLQAYHLKEFYKKLWIEQSRGYINFRSNATIKVNSAEQYALSIVFKKYSSDPITLCTQEKIIAGLNKNIYYATS